MVSDKVLRCPKCGLTVEQVRRYKRNKVTLYVHESKVVNGLISHVSFTKFCEVSDS